LFSFGKGTRNLDNQVQQSYHDNAIVPLPLEDENYVQMIGSCVYGPNSELDAREHFDDLLMA